VGRSGRNFGCAGSGFRTEGRDPGEKCFTLTPTEIGGTMAAVCWGQKGDIPANIAWPITVVERKKIPRRSIAYVPKISQYLSKQVSN
jgi:hypothetical protein